MDKYWYFTFCYLNLVCLFFSDEVKGLGVNWGTLAHHTLPPKTVVQMLKDNGINKVKLFDASEKIARALSRTEIEVMVAVPNGDLAAMTNYNSAKEWVLRNVTRYDFNDVKIKYVAVGNEPFWKEYNGKYENSIFPALKNIQTAINEAGLGNIIKATVPFDASVYGSPPSNQVPSAGTFRPDITSRMTQIVQFLSQNNAPFLVNIYPFLNLYGDPHFPVNFTFFDGGAKPILDNGLEYTNVFDASYDTLVSALKVVGYGNMPIIIGEIGWPTNGDMNANIKNAVKFYNGLLRKLSSNTGTPLRPGPIDMYLFGLFDEDDKPVGIGKFERHWGIFRYDGQPKFPMDLSGQNREIYLVGAKNVPYLKSQWCEFNPNANNLHKLVDSVEYACSRADCTPLGYGSSCNGLDANGNASYAFNAYFQAQRQHSMACNFEGLARLTTQNISAKNCNFTIQIDASGLKTTAVPVAFSLITMVLCLLF